MDIRDKEDGRKTDIMDRERDKEDGRKE